MDPANTEQTTFRSSITHGNIYTHPQSPALSSHTNLSWLKTYFNDGGVDGWLPNHVGQGCPVHSDEDACPHDLLKLTLLQNNAAGAGKQRQERNMRKEEAVQGARSSWDPPFLRHIQGCEASIPFLFLLPFHPYLWYILHPDRLQIGQPPFFPQHARDLFEGACAVVLQET